MDKVALTHEKFNDLCKNVADFFTAGSENYSTCAKDAKVCLDAIEDCQTKEKTNPEIAPANRKMLTATFAKYEFEVEPLAPNCDLTPIQRDFKIKFDSFSQFRDENHAAAKVLEKLPKLTVIFRTLQNDGISCSDPKLDPSAIFSDVLSRAKRQLNAIENPPDDSLQKFLVLYLLPIEDAQEICKVIAKLEQWILANIFTLAHRNNSFVPTIDTTNSEAIELLKRIEKRQAEQQTDLKTIKNNTDPKVLEKTAEKGVKKAIDAHRKKQRGPIRKSGGGKKPTFDVLDLQCKAFNVLYTEHANWRPSVLANEILKDPKWGTPKYKKDKPFLYTPGMTEKEKKVVRKNLINRFKTWRKRNGLSDPFP
jgi:hypothetical protein